MSLVIDGKVVVTTLSRHGSKWYVNPKNDRSCMIVSRIFDIGYNSKLGKISRCNEFQRRLSKALNVSGMSIKISYKASTHYSNSNHHTVKFTFVCQENEPAWNEQRLQEMLDTIMSTTI